MTDTPEVPIRDAASILVVDRDGPDGPAVLMGQRGKGAVFMPSKYVFPGGAVDKEDAAISLARPLSDATAARLAEDIRPESKATSASISAAALRELAEETGLTVGEPGAAPQSWLRYAALEHIPDPSALIYLFRAITPKGRPRRFDARFLVLDASRVHGNRHDFSFAGDELSHLHWVPLKQARKLDLPFITEVVLAELSELVARAGDGPLSDPPDVPFFDNRDETPRFHRIA